MRDSKYYTILVTGTVVSLISGLLIGCAASKVIDTSDSSSTNTQLVVEEQIPDESSNTGSASENSADASSESSIEISSSSETEDSSESTSEKVEPEAVESETTESETNTEEVKPETNIHIADDDNDGKLDGLLGKEGLTKYFFLMANADQTKAGYARLNAMDSSDSKYVFGYATFGINSININGYEITVESINDDGSYTIKDGDGYEVTVSPHEISDTELNMIQKFTGKDLSDYRN